jgi:hypothetical protein
MLASIQPASVNQSKGDLGIPADSEKRGNALVRRWRLAALGLPWTTLGAFIDVLLPNHEHFCCLGCGDKGRSRLLWSADAPHCLKANLLCEQPFLATVVFGPTVKKACRQVFKRSMPAQGNALAPLHSDQNLSDWYVHAHRNSPKDEPDDHYRKSRDIIKEALKYGA